MSKRRLSLRFGVVVSLLSALLLSVAVIVFLIGLVSEQITALMYARNDR